MSRPLSPTLSRNAGEGANDRCTNLATVATMQTCLASLDPVEMEITDDSHKHAGHAGVSNGGGHYVLRIVSPQFAGKNAVARHRMVYSALGEMMKREIHALDIRAYAPNEI